MKKTASDFLIWEEEKYFVAENIIYGISSFGRSEKTALKNLKEAVELFLDQEEGKACKELQSTKQ